MSPLPHVTPVPSTCTMGLLSTFPQCWGKRCPPKFPKASTPQLLGTCSSAGLSLVFCPDFTELSPALARAAGALPVKPRALGTHPDHHQRGASARSSPSKHMDKQQVHLVAVLVSRGTSMGWRNGPTGTS